jgi:predicted permease
MDKRLRLKTNSDQPTPTATPKSLWSKISYVGLSIFTSGPLMGLLALGLLYLALPSEMFSPVHSTLFAIAPSKVWGVLSLSLAVVGYAGLFWRIRRLWLLAHSFAAFLFLCMASFFANSGGFTNAALCLALAPNAWTRGVNLYCDPFSKCPLPSADVRS